MSKCERCDNEATSQVDVLGGKCPLCDGHWIHDNPILQEALAKRHRVCAECLEWFKGVVTQ